MQLIRKIFHRPAFIALIPPLGVIFDYTMTMFFSGGREAILSLEYSPILRAAEASNLVIPCIAALAIGYYALGYLALRSLAQTRFYTPGGLLLVLIGLTHASGGLSWVVRNPAYSDAVILLAAAGVLVALAAFLLALRSPGPARRAQAL